LQGGLDVCQLLVHILHGLQQTFECLIGILTAAGLIVLKSLWHPHFS